MNSFDVIHTVRLTEKGARQSEKLNQYTIKADPRANKTQIRSAVQELFKVKVTKVNTLVRKGKATRNRRTNTAGSKPDTKRAFVTLAAGDSIDLFEN